MKMYFIGISKLFICILLLFPLAGLINAGLRSLRGGNPAQISGNTPDPGAELPKLAAAVSRSLRGEINCLREIQANAEKGYKISQKALDSGKTMSKRHTANQPFLNNQDDFIKLRDYTSHKLSNLNKCLIITGNLQSTFPKLCKNGLYGVAIVYSHRCIHKLDSLHRLLPPPNETHAEDVEAASAKVGRP